MANNIRPILLKAMPNLIKAHKKTKRDNYFRYFEILGMINEKETFSWFNVSRIKTDGNIPLKNSVETEIHKKIGQLIDEKNQYILYQKAKSKIDKMAILFVATADLVLGLTLLKKIDIYVTPLIIFAFSFVAFYCESFFLKAYAKKHNIDEELKNITDAIFEIMEKTKKEILKKYPAYI